LLNLTGKRALITGAGSGIGLAIAEVFARQGALVTILDLDASKAAAAVATLSGGSSEHRGVVCDVSSEESVHRAFTQAGDVDLLVNSAGIAHVGSLTTTTAGDLDRLYAVNVRGTYLCMRSAVESMLPRGGGVILNLASIAATAGLQDRFAYSMTKGAVLAMTFSVAKDYLKRGIRCNCISPARVHTPFVDGFVARNYPGQEAEKMKLLEEAQPIGRMGRPEEVATLALYLCSDEASFITGADYPLDGGFFNLR
jgi:2-keto-3-deoxy-L-fuconate dehydrogenase